MTKKAEDDISMTAPYFSLGKVAGTIRRKGLVGALEDPEQGPHVHLTLLLGTIFIVSIAIVVITSL